MNIQTLTLGPLATNCYLVRADESSRAVIIDPAANSKRLLAALEKQGLTLEAILLTHAHFAHIGALKNLRAATNARVYIGEADKDDPSRMCHDLLTYTDTYRDGDFVTAGGLRFQVLATPGHTPGHVSLYAPQAKAVFTGDTLFRESIGRTDLPGGDYSWIMRSILDKIMPLGDDVKIYPGHGDQSDLGHEALYNPFIVEVLNNEVRYE